MENSTERSLSFGATIFLALALITLVVGVFILATDSSKAATSEFSSVTSELKDTKYLTFDSTEVAGSQVVNALRKFEKDGAGGTLGIYVKTGTGNGSWYYNTVSSDGNSITAAPKPTNVNNNTHAEYVNPSGLFKATVIRDSNQVIRAIKFQQN
ncbi:hypothetical protein MKZ20_22050 [Psychrobacillus sp. FSL K6-2684]|uniref:hypothetical protein n=1 Tax=unclassified Psychrobacillus TaxID=2636677 RepID=UPI00203B00E8|nr:hypothetical protein [Psychrobacillus sp. MER TA 171]MCM3358159.1 hypothetical protein [Psychrobacillus sp. MER TA 171]